jgi:hypothetical protein
MSTFEHDGTNIPDAPIKDPDSTLDYGCDWGPWLREGEIITASSWSLPSGIELGRDELGSEIPPSFTVTQTVIVLAGGEPNSRYHLTNEIKTNFGMTEQRSFVLLVRDK